MTWPGLMMKRPYRGLVVWLPREYYNAHDRHAGRPTVVVKVMSPERACIVMTRTSQTDVSHHEDIYHDADPKLPCCDKPGWWQPRRLYRVTFAAYNDEEIGEFATMDDVLLDRITAAYEGRS
jgi:hypothetical protein